MAKHLRRQIVEALAADLVGLPPWNANVFAQNVFTPRADATALYIEAPAEVRNEEEDEIARIHARRVAVELNGRIAFSAQFDEDADAFALAVEEAIRDLLTGARPGTFATLVEAVVYASMEKTKPTDSDLWGEVSITYEIDYRVDEVDFTIPG